MENIDPDRLMSLMEAPDLATDEEGAALIGCFEPETVLRLFLTPILEETGPLSAESSRCIRDGFVEADLYALVIAVMAEPGTDEEQEAAAALGMMAGFFSTLLCLNEEEFRAASPALGMGPEDREGLECLLDKLGGPEGMAALPQGEADPFLALFSAAVSCNLQISGEVNAEPVPGPTPAT